MLSLRLVIFAALFGIALWGLFALLDNLRAPELLRSAKSIIVKGCEPLESAQARKLCPQLLCQKFLLETRGVQRRSVFKVTVDARAGAEHLIGGVVRSGPAGGDQPFACILRNQQVTEGELIDGEQLETLAAQPEDWSLEQ